MSSPSFALSVGREANENREEKNGRVKILGARRTRKEGLPPKPKSLNCALLLQRKNMIGLW